MSRKGKIRSEALEFNIKKFLECTKEIKNFNELNRAWAWYDCQNAFNNNHKLTPAEIDYRAKELFIYLANWGMVARGSFIMKHTWRILKEVVTEISRKEYNVLRKIAISETEKDSHINTINSLYEEIAQILYKYHEDYKPDDSVQEKKDKSFLKVSSALITKILLGTTGCIVASIQMFVMLYQCFQILIIIQKFVEQEAYAEKVIIEKIVLLTYMISISLIKTLLIKK